MGIFDNVPGTPPQPAPAAPAAPQAPPGAYPPAAQGYATPSWAVAPQPQAPVPSAPHPWQQPGAPAVRPQAAPPRSAFDSVENERTFGDNVPFWTEQDNGVHVVIVNRVARFNTRKNVDTYSIEVKILVSSNPLLNPGMGRCKQEQANKDGAGGRIKKFVGAAAGVNADSVDDGSYHMSYGEQQPLTGTIMAVETSTGTSLKGSKFTNTAWRTLSPDEIRRYAPTAQQVDPAWKPSALQRAIFG